MSRMAQESFIVSLFNKLSLIERVDLWESQEDSEEVTLERLAFLWGQEATSYTREVQAR